MKDSELTIEDSEFSFPDFELSIALFERLYNLIVDSMFYHSIKRYWRCNKEYTIKLEVSSK